MRVDLPLKDRQLAFWHEESRVREAPGEILDAEKLDPCTFVGERLKLEICVRNEANVDHRTGDIVEPGLFALRVEFLDLFSRSRDLLKE